MITPNKKPPEIQTKTLRLDDFSMGLNTTISGSLLNNNELQIAEDVSFEQKGTIMPRRGRRKRYEEAFSDSPCCGLGSYYKKDGTTKLLFASGDKLYSDSPSISIKWDNQSDWEEPDSKQVNLDSSTTPGDIQIKESTQIAPTFTRDSVAYLSDGTEVASGQPRFEDGKFGKGILIEEGTTNLLTANQSSVEIDLTGFATWCQDGAISLTRDTTIAWHGAFSAKLTRTGTTQQDIVLYVEASVTPGQVYSFSVRCRANATRQMDVAIEWYTSSYGWISNFGGEAVTASPNVWYTLKVQNAVAPANAAIARTVLWLRGAAQGDALWWDGAQLEQKPYATSWTLGVSTRSPETLTIPTAGVLNPQEGTVELRVYVDPNVHKVTGSDWNMVFVVCDLATDEPNQLRFGYSRVSGKWHVKTSDSAGTSWYAEYSVASGWHYFALTWNRATATAKMYVDGVVVASNTAAPLPSAFASVAYIGSWIASVFQLNSLIDELRIDNIARTDEEIAEWYNANEPLIPDEYTTYLSHFDGSLSSEKLPYACWESAPKDVSQALNKASGKAVITQTLNSGQVALYSASSPTSSGTYSDWALALPDGTLQHPPDNFVKIKLKLTDTDPYTVLLMHMDGSDNGTTFTDECGKTVTVHGDVCTKTAEKKFGTASGYFNGDGDYLSLASSEDWDFGSGDFTIDFWLKSDSSQGTSAGALTLWTSTTNYIMFRLDNTADTSVQVSYGTYQYIPLGATYPATSWQHYALVKKGTLVTLYIDGVSKGSVTVSGSSGQYSELVVGAARWENSYYSFKGYIDELRISKGIARWTSDFTPPNSQYVLNSRPVVHGLNVTFDGEPSATPILDDMYFGAEYMFTTLKDILVIANGQNAPYKWDGVGTPTLLGGNPPVLDFITTHNNRVWGVDAANKSRVRFSDILDPETWSVLNFIDFNPDDGDYITAMIRIGQDLVVSKQWSMALLTGNATTNYSVVWLDVEQGVTGKRALCNTNKYFTYVAQDGIRFTDFNSHAVVSERLLPNWEKINKRRLNQAAMVYWRNYLLVALPMDNSLYNNTVWAYDMLRNAWSIINGWNVSNWLIFKQYGEEVLLAADSTTGQIYEVMRYSRYDDTEPVTYNIRTKDFTFDVPERYKLFRNINLDLEATAVESPLTVDLIVDGEKVGEYNTIIPANDRAKVHRMILPPLYNAVIGRSLSLALRGRCGIQGISLTYSFGGIVPDEEVVG